MTSGAINASASNRRPHFVTSLLTGGEDHATWAYANQRAVRFYLVNLEQVLGRLNLNVTNGKPYFDRAEASIKDETVWNNDHPFPYKCSHTQIYTDKIKSPKLFGHAATIIVAMELVAHEKNPALNVYDYLRILPAQYFPDRFDAARLKQLEEFHHDMTPEAKTQKFGAALADKAFEETCLVQIEQTRPGILAAITDGGCVTKYTAEKIVDFVNTNYPAEFAIGPVCSSGDEKALSENLGKGNAVEGLRVPRTIAREDLKPCF